VIESITQREVGERGREWFNWLIKRLTELKVDEREGEEVDREVKNTRFLKYEVGERGRKVVDW
jgi:hypothetical protein